MGRASPRKLHYVPQSAGPDALAEAVKEAETELGEHVPPAALPERPAEGGDRRSSTMLRDADLVDRSRVIMEKPFGTDLGSAVELNRRVHETFSEEQIFRIDHFLGKEPALNILAFRFANGLFEPIWNRNFIDHVQIDVPETLGLDNRADFYEATGAYKDMVVTHLFQVMAFVAMEPPTALEPRAISEEKNKVFRSLLPIDPDDVVRGQYTGYRERGRASPDSDTETFIALQGRHRQLALGGRPVLPAHRQEDGRGACGSSRSPSGRRRRACSRRAPGSAPRDPTTSPSTWRTTSKVSLSFYGKRPGPGHAAGEAQHAVLHPGDRPRRRRPRGLRAAHARRHVGRPHALHHRRGHREPVGAVEPLLDDPPPVKPYPPGSWGPNAIHQLIAPHAWRLPFERVWREKK